MFSVTPAQIVSSSCIPQQEIMEGTLLSSATRIIDQLHKLPGIGSNATLAEVTKHRENLQLCISQLAVTGRWNVEQDDALLRPIAVGLQAIIEHALLDMLQKEEIAKVMTIFTTQNPPTPLCSEPGVLPDSLVTVSVQHSPACVDTVISRQQTLKALLAHPSIDTWVFYAQPRPNPEEQTIFDENAMRYAPNFHHFHVSDGILENLSGATYRLTDQEGQDQWFGIRITQANQLSSQCILFTEKGGINEIKDLLEWGGPRGLVCSIGPQNIFG